MRVGVWVRVCFISLLMASAAWAAPSVDFKALMQNELDAWTTMDMAQVAPFYAQEPDRVFFDIAPLKYTGWAAYSDGFRQVSADFKSIHFQLNDDINVNRHGASFAWATATFHAEFEMKDSSTTSMEGRWTVIWQKFGRKWLVVHEHVSSPLPPPHSGSGE